MGGGGGGVLIVMNSRSLETIDPRTPMIECRDGARQVFTDQADIACTKRDRGDGAFTAVHTYS